MKKTFLLAVMIMAAYSAQAQFEITSNGIIKIGSNTTTSARMNIKSASTSIHAKRYNTAAGIAPVLEGVSEANITGENTQWTMGVRGVTYGTGNIVNCGIWGAANSNSNNKTYGVFGCLNSNKGAAIYGQAYSWQSSSGVALTTPYAGYFDGNVYVLGNFGYSGSILTAMPSPSSIQSESLSTRSEAAANTSYQLQTLDVQSYYHTAPLRSHTKAMTEKDFAGMDSMEIETIKRIAAEEGEYKDPWADQVYAKKHYALNVNQLEEVFPDLVYENEDGTKSINYVEMVPILVQAINELSAKVETLEGSNTAKKAATRGTTNIDGMGENVMMLSLGQNKPNPFGTTTSIEVSIPNDVQKAFIYVYDLQGKKVDQVDITARGKQTIQLNAANLSDGMYLYSLIVDGKVVETRRMIVEK